MQNILSKATLLVVLTAMPVVQAYRFADLPKYFFAKREPKTVFSRFSDKLSNVVKTTKINVVKAANKTTLVVKNNPGCSALVAAAIAAASYAIYHSPSGFGCGENVAVGQENGCCICLEEFKKTEDKKRIPCGLFLDSGEYRQHTGFICAQCWARCPECPVCRAPKEFTFKS